MRCPRCGNASEPGAHFCGVCGMRLARAASGGAAQQPSNPQIAPQAFPAPAAPSPAPSSPAAVAPALATAQVPGEMHSSKPMGKQAGMPRMAPQPSAQMSARPSAQLYGQPDPYLGTTLKSRFGVEVKLGEGGFGAVYRGTQLATGRKVALKLLHPEMTRDENVVARFRREGQVLCSLRDAHTITTYDFDQTEDGTLFIAMELLEGRSLHDIFHDQAPIAWPRMLKIVSETCSSLHEAHGQGIVHRDLKPENIYLENRPGNPEFVKVLDFGIAKVVRGDGIAGFSGGPQLTATGQTLGTLEYMSPEQLMGKPLDGRSDIYGLGVVTFELLTGRLPFPDAVGPAALISAQLKKIPPRVSEAHSGGTIPPEVDALVARMLEKDKDRRFKDVSELRIACEQLLAGSQSIPVGMVSSGPAAAMAMSPSATPPPRAAMPPPGAMPPHQFHSAPTPTPTPVAASHTPVPQAPGPISSTAEAIAASKQGSSLWLWMIFAFVVVVGGIVGAIILLG